LCECGWVAGALIREKQSQKLKELSLFPFGESSRMIAAAGLRSITAGDTPYMRTLFWVGLIAGLSAWVFALRRRLYAARMRGDMYRDIAARLDRRLAELSERGG
jgi:hypothetical protein